MGAFSYENFIRSLFLLWILLLFVASYIYLPSIDRKVVFFFCNVILFVVIKLSIMKNQEPTKIAAVIVIKHSIMEDQEPTKIDAAVVIKQSIMEEDQEPTKSIVENQEPTKIGAAVVIKQSTEEDQKPTKIGSAFDRGNEKKSRVVVSVELVEVENEEEEGKMIMGIDEKVSEAKDEKRDELQKKIEAFIENVKNQWRMEDLQLVTMSRERRRKLKN